VQTVAMPTATHHINPRREERGPDTYVHTFDNIARES
jgi:hypothetical protein